MKASKELISTIIGLTSLYHNTIQFDEESDAWQPPYDALISFCQKMVPEIKPNDIDIMLELGIKEEDRIKVPEIVHKMLNKKSN